MGSEHHDNRHHDYEHNGSMRVWCTKKEKGEKKGRKKDSEEERGEEHSLLMGENAS